MSHAIGRKIVDVEQVLRGERSGRTDDGQITYFKNCAFWGIGAAAIGGLIYDKLLEQRRELILDFNAHEFHDDRGKKIGQPIGNVGPRQIEIFTIPLAC